jgi:hypothetical protein
LAEGRAGRVVAEAFGVGVPVAVGVADALGVPVSVVVVALTWVGAAGVAAACPASVLRSGSDPMTR